MMDFIIGSTLTSIGLVVCGGSILLVALAFILYYAVTGSARARTDSSIWGPQEPERPRYNRGRFVPPARFGGIPSTGSSRPPDDEDSEHDPGARE